MTIDAAGAAIVAAGTAGTFWLQTSTFFLIVHYFLFLVTDGKECGCFRHHQCAHQHLLLPIQQESFFLFKHSSNSVLDYNLATLVDTAANACSIHANRQTTLGKQMLH